MSRDLVTLTNTEKQERGAQLVEKLSELYKIRADKKVANKQFASKIEKIESEISELTLTIRTGKEIKENTFFDNQPDEDDDE